MMSNEEQKEQNLKCIKAVKNKLSNWINAWNKDGHNLDYSEESLKDIDDILLFHHQSGTYIENIDSFELISYFYGFYIIEVLENNYETGVMSFDDLKYYWRDIFLFPAIWCKKVVQHGESDSVLFKYNMVVLEYQ